jgi:hypothetical protein
MLLNTFVKTFTQHLHREKQCLISIKDKNIYCNSEVNNYVDNTEFLKNKKLITISPGGFKGFYLLGVLTYIKEKYNMDNFIYSGASAGSWNSLFMCYKGDPINLVYNLVDYDMKKTKTIPELEMFFKYKLLTTYKDDDFDLKRLFIGVTGVTNFKPSTNIYSGFENLDDAINCCIASSHIPFLTGGLTNRYHNLYTFDGGFSTYPYLNSDNVVLHFSPSMWDEIKDKPTNVIKRNIRTIKNLKELFSPSKNNLLELFDHGYQDAKKHKEYLDLLFVSKDFENTVHDKNDGVIEI